MVHFLDSSSDPKKPTLTLLDREDDPIEEDVTLRVDMPTPFPTRRFLLHNYLADSCWSVESTCDKQRPDGVILTLRVLKLSSILFTSSTPSQEVAPLLRHRIADGTLSWGNFSPCFSDNFFISCYWKWLEDVLGYNKGLMEWRLYDRLYASLFSYDISLIVFKAFCELRRHTSNTFCIESSDISISLWNLQAIGGLPADGAYYEEVLLSSRELLSTGHGDNDILATCSFLFSTFHRLYQDIHGIV